MSMEDTESSAHDEWSATESVEILGTEEEHGDAIKIKEFTNMSLDMLTRNLERESVGVRGPIEGQVPLDHFLAFMEEHDRFKAEGYASFEHRAMLAIAVQGVVYKGELNERMLVHFIQWFSDADKVEASIANYNPETSHYTGRLRAYYDVEGV